VGQLRVVYAIDEAAQRVTIVRVARRSESTYRRFRDEGLRRHQPTQETA
jgi:mRNA-degrading endonuclease RelE of RelBE toxin-antitoxin system